MELLAGCGNSRVKKINLSILPEGWTNLITLDYDETCKPDVVHDLNSCPYPFDDDMFDEVHCYEVLEHLGKQGDYRAYFEHFSEIWRILKPGGVLVATVPMWDSLWAWGDPSHTRIINQGSLVFLNQEEYKKQIGKNAMTDFRHCYRADFDIILLGGSDDTGKVVELDRATGDTFAFALQAVKPSRYEP